MKASTTLKAAGKLREVERALEAAVSEAARNRDLVDEGKREKRVRKVPNGARRVEKAAGK